MATVHNLQVIPVGLVQGRSKVMDFNFKSMQQSIASETKDLSPTTGISIALFRLKELMEGYQYAIEKGYEVPFQEEDPS